MLSKAILDIIQAKSSTGSPVFLPASFQSYRAVYFDRVSPIPASSWRSGALFTTFTSTIIASGIVHLKLFLALPSVPSMATGDARESFESVVGSDSSLVFETKAANFARSRTVPPPNPITSFMSFMVICFASAAALS